MNADQIIRDQLVNVLRVGNAHLSFDQAVANFPPSDINRQPPNVPYSFWHLLEHLRIAQWDILEFIRDSGHVSPDWPREYWPEPEETADLAQWRQTIAQFHADRDALLAIIQDPNVDLTAPIPHAPDYTILREILVVSDHNAYHIGEFAILRQVVGNWPEAG